MADDFEGREIITIRPSTKDYPVGMSFSTCTSETANDGAIPFGDAISSAVVKAYGPTGADVTASLVTIPATVQGNNLKCAISWYAGITPGLHTLTVVLTMASGHVDEFDLKRVIVEAN
ncbi:MAG: hypothetical protein LLG06_05920 [Desulfobacteraceae bacterium]|nr:hypothetical protein [Desulfobacteraceae bacterium]